MSCWCTSTCEILNGLDEDNGGRLGYDTTSGNYSGYTESIGLISLNLLTPPKLSWNLKLRSFNVGNCVHLGFQTELWSSTSMLSPKHKSIDIPYLLLPLSPNPNVTDVSGYPSWFRMAGSSWCVWSLQFLPSTVGHHHPLLPFVTKENDLLGKDMSSRRYPIFRWFRIGRVISETRTQIQLWFFGFGRSWGDPLSENQHWKMNGCKTGIKFLQDQEIKQYIITESHISKHITGYKWYNLYNCTSFKIHTSRCTNPRNL